jgi:hypothetical protein
VIVGDDNAIRIGHQTSTPADGSWSIVVRALDSPLLAQRFRCNLFFGEQGELSDHRSIGCDLVVLDFLCRSD